MLRFASHEFFHGVIKPNTKRYTVNIDVLKYVQKNGLSKSSFSYKNCSEEKQKEYFVSLSHLAYNRRPNIIPWLAHLMTPKLYQPITIKICLVIFYAFYWSFSYGVVVLIFDSSKTRPMSNVFIVTLLRVANARRTESLNHLASQCMHWHKFV